jgi:hypothetical protein
VAWSPYKDAVVNYVRQHPGCCKLDVARFVTHNPQRNPSKQYDIVNTAIRHGWIKAVRRGVRWSLYVPGDKVGADIAISGD